MGLQLKGVASRLLVTLRCTYALGFYTPTGAFTIAGIHALPIYLYFWKYRPHSWIFLDRIHFLLLIPIVILGMARLLGFLVEVIKLLNWTHIL